MSSLEQRRKVKRISLGEFFERLGKPFQRNDGPTELENRVRCLPKIYNTVKPEPPSREVVALSRRMFFAGVVAASVVAHPQISKAAYLPFTKPVFNALDYGVRGDGTTNDAAAINAFNTRCIAAGAVAYYPGNRTYNCGADGIIAGDASVVLCGGGARFLRSQNAASRTVYAAPSGSLLNIGSNATWTGGTFDKTSVIGTSASSVSVGLGAKVFTVAAGLPIANGDFIRCWSTASPQNYVEGVVTYSGTTLTITSAFINGSGTFAAWTFDWGAVFQSAICLQNTTKSIVDGVAMQGFFYTGLILSADRVAFPGTVSVSNDVRDCWATGVFNRSFYQYGNCDRNKFLNCHVDGVSGRSDYGFNFNAANTGSNPNAIQRTTVTNCTVTGCGFQGFTIGDASFYNTFSNCVASNISNSAGVGFEVINANGGTPQFNTFVGCIAQACAGQGFGVFGAFYNTFSGIAAISCGNGIQVDTSVVTSSENSFWAFTVTGCTGTGVLLGAGSVNTIVNGRSVNNTTNYTNSGSGTVGTVTTT